MCGLKSMSFVTRFNEFTCGTAYFEIDPFVFYVEVSFTSLALSLARLALENI